MPSPKKKNDSCRGKQQPPQSVDGASANAEMSDEELIRHCTQFIGCECCGKLNAKMRCSRCQLAHYCSRECQVKDWKQEHKSDCADLEELRKEHSFRVQCQLSSTKLENNEQKQHQVLKAEPKCAICFEQPMVKPVVLEKCHHAFCFPCLLHWNSAHQATQSRLGFGPSGTTSTALTCPLCRQVIPNMGHAVMADIKQLLFSAQEVNVSESFVLEQCTKALAKMDLLREIKEMENDPMIVLQYHRQLLHDQFCIHKALKEYGKALKVAKELEAELRPAVQNGLALKALMEQMESMRLDPNAHDETMDKVRTLITMPRASPNDHIQALLLMVQIQGFQSDWIGVKSTLLDILSLYEEDMTGKHQWEILLDFSRCYYELGEYKDAILSGLDAIAMNRNFPGCRHYVILAYLASPNKHREAQQCAAEAVLYETPWDKLHHAVTKKFYREHFLR